MAISEDTAALVAAQLTQAWATHTRGAKFMGDTAPDERIFSAYEWFFAKVKGSGPKPTYSIQTLG